jgi:hypothetical protein
VTLDRAAPASADSGRARPVPRWMHRPALDVAIAFAWVPFALAAHALEWRPAHLGTFVAAVFVLSFAHQPLTLALVYGDGARFRLRPTIFTWSPLVFAVVIFAGLHMSLLALAIVAGLWNAEHTLMQRYGITRIYGRKVGQDAGGLEKAMLWSWLVLALVWVAADARTPAGLDRLGLSGTNALAVQQMIRFTGVARVLLVPLVAVVTGLVAAWIVAEWRRGPATNPAKWIYLGSTAALFGVVLADPIAGLMGYVGAHAIEYFVVVHQSLGRYESADQPDKADPALARPPLLGRAVGARSGRLGFLAVYLGLVMAVVTALQWYGDATAYAIVFFTVGGLHVFYDGFIWKLRRPDVAASLAIPGGSAAAGSTH